MNYNVEDIRKIIQLAPDAPEPYRDWLIGLIEDWRDLMKNDADKLADKLAEDLSAASRLSGELDLLEKILKLPLCEKCKTLIERSTQ